MYDADREYHSMLKRLKEICRQKRVSQYALAKATGMSTSSISSLMSKVVSPTTLQLNVVVNLIHHLFELTSIYSISAHKASLQILALNCVINCYICNIMLRVHQCEEFCNWYYSLGVIRIWNPNKRCIHLMKEFATLIYLPLHSIWREVKMRSFA